MKNVKVLINPTSGNGVGKTLLKRKGHWIAQETQPSRICRQLIEFLQPNDILIIAGGDGTVNLVIDALYQTKLYKTVKISLLPLGTGNDLALSLNVKKIDLEKLVNNIQTRQNSVLLPLFQFNNKIFTNYISFGLDAKILADVSQWRKNFPDNQLVTKSLYLIAGIKSLFYNKKIKINVNNQTENLLGIMLCNISSYAGGCVIKSKGGPILTYVKIKTRWDLIKLMLTRFSKKPYSTVFLDSPVKIEHNANYVQLDGELIDTNSGTIIHCGSVSIIK